MTAADFAICRFDSIRTTRLKKDQRKQNMKRSPKIKKKFACYEVPILRLQQRSWQTNGPAAIFIICRAADVTPIERTL